MAVAFSASTPHEAGAPATAANTRPPERVFETITPSRNITPPDTTPWPMPEGPVERLPPDPVPEPPAEPPAPERLGRVVVRDARTLVSGDTRIVLANIETRAREARCTDPDGFDWPCGQAALTQLRMLIRGRAISCDPLEEDAPAHAPRRCYIGSIDLAEWMVAGGWATPAAGAPQAYRDAHDAARREGRGAFGRAWGRD